MTQSVGNSFLYTWKPSTRFMEMLYNLQFLAHYLTIVSDKNFIGHVRGIKSAIAAARSRIVSYERWKLIYNNSLNCATKHEWNWLGCVNTCRFFTDFTFMFDFFFFRFKFLSLERIYAIHVLKGFEIEQIVDCRNCAISKNFEVVQSERCLRNLNLCNLQTRQW